MNKKIFIGYFGIVTAIFIIASKSQPPNPQSNLTMSVVAKMKDYYSWYPQQKAYLHTDKNRYDVSEKIWFKAYVVDASTHFPDNLSSNLYVELVNPKGYVVQTKLIKL